MGCTVSADVHGPTLPERLMECGPLEGVGRCMGPRTEEGDNVEGHGDGRRKSGVCHVKNTNTLVKALEEKGYSQSKELGALSVPPVFRGYTVTYTATHANRDGVSWAEKRKVARPLLLPPTTMVATPTYAYLLVRAMSPNVSRPPCCGGTVGGSIFWPS